MKESLTTLGVSLASLCVVSGLAALLIAGIFFFLFHLGVNDFQGYEREE